MVANVTRLLAVTYIREVKVIHHTLRHLVPLALVGFFCVGCSTQPMLKYQEIKDANNKSDVIGYPFVVPRTVVKVEYSKDKNNNQEKITYTPVPAYYDSNFNPLKRFLAIDDSSSSFTPTSTTITGVTYADNLIISSIGTQITDNRKDAINAIFSLTTAAGIFKAAKVAPPCAADAPLTPFVIEDFRSTPESLAPMNTCWGLKIEHAKYADADFNADDVANLPLNKRVNWFPIPACKTYSISVYRCPASGSCLPDSKITIFNAVVSVSDGNQYVKMPLPSKGKISMHTDFCGADVTNDTTLVSSNWSLLNQVISDVKSAKQSGQTNSKN